MNCLKCGKKMKPKFKQDSTGKHWYWVCKCGNETLVDKKRKLK